MFTAAIAAQLHHLHCGQLCTLGSPSLTGQERLSRIVLLNMGNCVSGDVDRPVGIAGGNHWAAAVGVELVWLSVIT